MHTVSVPAERGTGAGKGRGKPGFRESETSRKRGKAVHRFRSLCAFLLAGVIVISTSACRQEPDRSHRLQWWLEAIHWDERDRGSGLSGKGVVIAVIDTAIDATHPDLEGKIQEQYIAGEVSEPMKLEHGTAVAGIIAASPSNEDGVLGIAVGAQILSIVIDEYVDSLIKGIEYAIEKDVDIINISAGITENNPRLESVIEEAYQAGICVVAAYGEERPLYPALYEHVISVGSVNSEGKDIFGGDTTSIFLPGGNIVTTYSSVYEPRKYVSYTGASMSAAMMTGIIALVLEQNPGLDSNQIVGFFGDYKNREFNTVEVLEHFKNWY